MKHLIIILFALNALFAQKIIPNGSTGGGSSSTGGTIPVYTVATLPATCTASPNKQLAWATDATIATGRTNLYACTATDTWTQVWGCQGNADGSVTVVGTGLYCDIQVTPGVFGELAGANTWTGSNTRTNSTDKPPATVFASLPAAASNSGDVYIVTDCATAACAAGSGTIKSWVRSNGSSYDVVSPGSTGITISNPSASRTFCATNAGGTALDCNPGLASINNGYNIAVGPSISYYLNGLGNVTTCATTAAIQSYSNAAAFDLTGNCTLTGPATAYASVTFSPIYVIACADGSNRDLVPPANFLGWTPGTAGTLTANTCSGALFVGYGNYYYALGSFANQVK